MSRPRWIWSGRYWWCLVVLAAMCGSCIPLVGDSSVGTSLALETELMVFNNSQSCVLLRLEVPGTTSQLLPLLPPGAVYRKLFREVLGVACPAEMIVRGYVYQTSGETAVQTSDETANATDSCGDKADDGTNSCSNCVLVASGEATVFPAAGTGENDTAVYTIDFRDALSERGTILFAEDTTRYCRFDFSGLNLPEEDSLPPKLESKPIAGRVVFLKDRGISGVRIKLSSLYYGAGWSCTNNDVAIDSALVFCGANKETRPPCCGDEPYPTPFPRAIETTCTDEDGRFAFNQPPGAYVLDVFADNLQFRPTSIIIEAPLDNVLFIAETPSDTAQTAGKGTSLLPPTKTVTIRQGGMP